MVRSLSSGPRRSSSGITQPLPPKFLLRNRNGELNPESPNETVTKRGTDEIREHLKHLGPSNLASRPRQTRYQTVKIKAPGASPSRSGYTESDGGRRVSIEPRRRSEPLSYGVVSPPGQESAEDGHPLRYSYGTLGLHSPHPETPSAAYPAQGNQPIQDSFDTSIVVPEAIEEDDLDVRSRQPSSSYKTPYRDEAEAANQPAENRFSRHSGVARSGSITEQIIDVNGVRKVVLQTTSSSSSLSSETGHRSLRSANPPPTSQPQDLESPGGKAPSQTTDGEEGEDYEDSEQRFGRTGPLESLISRVAGGGSVKNRRRRKKKSKSESSQLPETQSLLK
jgi:metal transporter CNNM